MTSYLIVGDGRMARHFSHYLAILGLKHHTWSRKNDSLAALRTLADSADRVLLLISDSQIEDFVRENSFLKSRRLVHFSGALSSSFAESAHPLNTFGESLYARDVYLQTPFIIETGRSTFENLLPGLPNPHFAIPAEKKALYHSLCVVSGNFTTLLWQNVTERFARDLGLPANVLHSYLDQTAANLKASNSTALTGPIARGDVNTILRHLDALRDSPEQKLYYAFLNYVLEKKNRIGDLHYERLDL